MPVICPCCMQPMPVDRAPVDVLEHAPLSPLERKIVKALTDSYPRRVTMRQLVETCYWDDIDGGPENPELVIRCKMHALRRKLPSHGWTIPTLRRGPAIGLNAYRLEPVKT